MNYRQKLFIYGRGEMFILTLLFFMMGLFLFTLGIHLEKRMGGKTGDTPIEATSILRSLSDPIPNRLEFTEQGQGVASTVDEILNQELREEVKKRGIRLKIPRPVHLPEKAQSKNAGATTLLIKRNQEVLKRMANQQKAESAP